MNPKTRKLAKKVGDLELAQALVKAGIENPADLRAASDAELDRIVGKAARKALREK